MNVTSVLFFEIFVLVIRHFRCTIVPNCSLKWVCNKLCICQDLHAAMKMLGLNPMEQEIIDLTNNIVRNGFIYFPEFCAVILKKFREDDEDVFNQNMFKVLFYCQILYTVTIAKLCLQNFADYRPTRNRARQ